MDLTASKVRRSNEEHHAKISACEQWVAVCLGNVDEDSSKDHGFPVPGLILCSLHRHFQDKLQPSGVCALPP